MCLPVCVPVSVLWLRVSGLDSVSFLRDSCRDAVAFSLFTATVASRGAEFGLFEWSSRSLCRGAGFQGLTRRGRRSNFQQVFSFFPPKNSSHMREYFIKLHRTASRLNTWIRVNYKLFKYL